MKTKYLIDFAALAVIYFSAFFRRWKRKGRDVFLFNTLMYVYLAFVIRLTLMPVLASVPTMLTHGYVPMNMVPFVDVKAGWAGAESQIVLNILMTVPFSFLLPLTGKRKARFAVTLFCCFLMSLFIELVQPLISDYRVSDITDIITNVTGGVIGYILYMFLRPLIFKDIRRLKAKRKPTDKG